MAERLADALADQVGRRGARSLRDVFRDLDRSDRGFIEVRDFERALEDDLRLRIDRKDLDFIVHDLTGTVMEGSSTANLNDSARKTVDTAAKQHSVRQWMAVETLTTTADH